MKGNTAATLAAAIATVVRPQTPQAPNENPTIQERPESGDIWEHKNKSRTVRIEIGEISENTVTGTLTYTSNTALRTGVTKTTVMSTFTTDPKWQKVA